MSNISRVGEVTGMISSRRSSSKAVLEEYFFAKNSASLNSMLSSEQRDLGISSTREPSKNKDANYQWHIPMKNKRLLIVHCHLRIEAQFNCLRKARNEKLTTSIYTQTHFKH